MNPTFASLSLAHLRTLDHLLQLKTSATRPSAWVSANRP